VCYTHPVRQQLSVVLLACVIVGGASACGASPDSGSAANGTDATPTEAPAIGECAAGARPVAGGASCAPVGTTKVPDGFATAKDGWGFDAVLPVTACTGATIATLGHDTCEPIDDCAAPFPPTNAKVVVRGDGSPVAGRPDVTVVKTLAEAFAVATATSTIAVDAGEFALPTTLGRSARVVGRCAERTSLRGGDFGVNVDSAIKVSFQSVAFVGAVKTSFLLNHSAIVELDRVYVHGAGSGPTVGNGSTLTAVRTVFEAPSESPNPNAALTGIHATYNGHVKLTGVETRGYQLAVLAESKGTAVSVVKSVLHDQRELGAGLEALSQVSAFLGASIAIDQSHIEAAPGRIAMIGSGRLDGQTDPTSPGDPPASIRATNSTLVHTGVRREHGSGIDTVDRATVELDNVTFRHDGYAGVSASDDAVATVRNTVIKTENSAANARIGVAITRRGKGIADSTAIVGAAMFAVLVDDASSVDLTGSLIAGTREVGIANPTIFMGAAQALTVSPRGKATVRDCAFVVNQGTSMFLQEATADVASTVFASTTASSAGAFSASITGIDATLLVRGSTFSKNDRGIALRNGRALLSESAVSDNHEALRLDGVALLESDAFDDTVDEKLVVARTSFVRNAVRVSSKSLTDE
jgi:hypothetical protein